MSTTVKDVISRAEVLSVYSRPDGEIGAEIRKNVIPSESSATRAASASRSRTASRHSRAVRQGRDILAGMWRVEGAVSVRERLTYPEGM